MCRAFSTLAQPEKFPHELPVAVEPVGANHFGSGRQQTGELKPQRIVQVGMKRLGREEDDLPQRRKGGKEKVMAVRRLQQETTIILSQVGD